MLPPVHIFNANLFLLLYDGLHTSEQMDFLELVKEVIESSDVEVLDNKEELITVITENFARSILDIGCCPMK